MDEEIDDLKAHHMSSTCCKCMTGSELRSVLAVHRWDLPNLASTRSTCKIELY